MKIRPVGAELFHADRRNFGQRDRTKLIVAQPLYYPSNALTCIKCMVIRNIKNIKLAPTCFGSRRNHPQGANVST